MKVSLKALRNNKNLSQFQVADKLGINKATLHNWETGKTSPSGYTLIKLCDIYECGLDDFYLPNKLAKSE